MKTIGLIGGMSWESSAVYYKLINEQIRAKLGGSHSAKMLMYSFDFNEIKTLQYQGKWNELKEQIEQKARALKDAGADFCVLCTNTMHKVADELEKNTGLELLHIGEVVKEAILQDKLEVVGLLGTKFTMSERFLIAKIEQNSNIKVLLPSKEEQEKINEIIYKELVLGKIEPKSRKIYENIISNLVQKGAKGIILGCTEIGLLVKNAPVNLYDTTFIHSKAAAKKALER